MHQLDGAMTTRLSFAPITQSDQRVDYTISNGFELMVTYHPYHYVRIGGVYTNWANARQVTCNRQNPNLVWWDFWQRHGLGLGK